MSTAVQPGSDSSDFYARTPDEQAIKLTELASAAVSEWDIDSDAEIELLKHRENAVFAVTASEGERYALRVHRFNYHSDADIRSELQWMAYLNDNGVKTPQPIWSSNGELLHTVSVASVPESRQCDLISWIDGTAIGSIEEGLEDEAAAIETYRSIGEIAATIHNASEAWTLPDGFSRQAWDEDGLAGDAPLWGRFQDLEVLTENQRQLLLLARDRAVETILAFGKDPDRYGLIHCDLLPENLFQTDDGLCLIDFDDSGFGWHLFEFATSLFFHLGEPHFDAISAAMIEGYRSERELPDEHLALLPTFFVLRGLVYLGWAHSRKETETAQQLTPMVVEGVTALATDYLGID